MTGYIRSRKLTTAPRYLPPLVDDGIDYTDCPDLCRGKRERQPGPDPDDVAEDRRERRLDREDEADEIRRRREER